MNHNPYQKDIDLIIDNIEEFIDNCERTKTAYFWQPPSYASQRKNYESRHTYSLNEVFEIYRLKGTKKGCFLIHILADLHLTCSCKHIYRYCHIHLNRIPINLTVLKHLFAILKEDKVLTSQFIKKYHLEPIYRSKEDLENESANS